MNGTGEGRGSQEKLTKESGMIRRVTRIRAGKRTRRLEIVLRGFECMDLGDGQCDKPHASFNAALRYIRGFMSAKVSEAAGIEASLSVISEKEVFTLRDVENLFGRVTCVHRIAIGLSLVHCAEVRLLKLDISLDLVPEINVTVTNNNGFAWKANDTLHVVFPGIRRWSENNDVTALGRCEQIAEFIDNDVLLMFKRIDHGIPFDLKRGYDKSADDGNNRNNDDDVQRDIEDVEPQAPPDVCSHTETVYREGGSFGSPG